MRCRRSAAIRRQKPPGSETSGCRVTFIDSCSAQGCCPSAGTQERRSVSHRLRRVAPTGTSAESVAARRRACRSSGRSSAAGATSSCRAPVWSRQVPQMASSSRRPGPRVKAPERRRCLHPRQQPWGPGSGRLHHRDRLTMSAAAVPPRAIAARRVGNRRTTRASVATTVGR